MKTNTSIQVSIAKQIWKLIRIAFKFLKRGISNSILLKRSLNDVIQEYEFSCSNSPAVKKWRNRGLNHRRYCYGVNETDVASAVQRIFDMMNREAAETPVVLPEFGATPVRQLRVTDSPFPEGKGCEEEEAQVSKAAEEFIRRFYGNLRREKSLESPLTWYYR